MVSANLSGKSLYLMDIDNPEGALQLAFLEKYGDIIKHIWFGEGLILIGFRYDDKYYY